MEAILLRMERRIIATAECADEAENQKSDEKKKSNEISAVEYLTIRKRREDLQFRVKKKKGRKRLSQLKQTL